MVRILKYGILAICLFSGCEAGPKLEKTKVSLPSSDTVVESCLTADDSIWINHPSVGGCGGVTVYGYIDSTHFIVITMDTDLYPLKGNTIALNLEDHHPGITIEVYQPLANLSKEDKKKPFYIPVCTDLINTQARPYTVIDRVKKGSLCFTRSEGEDSEGTYFCTVKVENLVMESGGTKVSTYKLPEFVFYKVRVGWNAG